MNQNKNYREKAEAQQDEWNADVEKAKAKVKKGWADAKIKINEAIDNVSKD